MEEVIKKIILIENKAQKITDEAEKEVQNKKKELEMKLNELKKNLQDHAQQKIRTIRETEIAEAYKESDKIINESQEKAKEIQRKFDMNEEKWVQELVDAVLMG